MRRGSRFLPIVVGLLLGYVLVSPPRALAGLGAWRWPAVIGLVLLGLLAFTAYQLSANLPADPPLAPATEAEVRGELRNLCARFEALGFERVGPPMTIGIRPPGLLVPFVQKAEHCYGTAFRTSTLPPRTAFDCVSILEGDRGSLTTGADPGGAVVPAARGSFRQVFPRASVEKVFERHREGLQYLRSRGLAARPVNASTFPHDFAASFRRQREAFATAPLRTAAITLWRAGTGRTPHLGPIDAQPAAQAAIHELVTGSRG